MEQIGICMFVYLCDNDNLSMVKKWNGGDANKIFQVNCSF